MVTKNTGSRTRHNFDRGVEEEGWKAASFRPSNVLGKDNGNEKKQLIPRRGFGRQQATANNYQIINGFHEENI